MLDRLADRQAEFSETANHLKRRLDQTRISCFGLSLAGAALAAVAAGLPPSSGGYHAALAWAAAAMLAVGTFMTARLLGPDAVSLQVKARMASEALKREAFLFATAAPPYDDALTRDDRLAENLDRVEGNAEGLGLHEQAATGPGSCPRKPLDAAGYINVRLSRQIAFYRAAADKMARPSQLLHRAELTLAGAAAVITAVAASVGKRDFDLASLTAVITTLVGTIVAHLQGARYDQLILRYRATANRLANLKAKMSSSPSAAEVATATEAILADETQSWQASWLKDGAQNTHGSTFRV